MVINGKKLNKIEKLIFHMSSIQIIAAGTTALMAAFAVSTAIIYKATQLDSGIKMALTLNLSFFLLYGGILFSKKVIPDLGWKKEEAEETIKNALVINSETLQNYILITHNTEFLKKSSGDPIIDTLKRRLGRDNPTILGTLENPTTMDLLQLIKRRGELAAPIKISAEKTLKDFDEDDRIIMYKAIHEIEANDPFAMKAIRTLGMDRIDEEIKEVISFKGKK